MQGYGSPHYTNVVMPFPDEPPHVPSQNPTGIYRREFTVPDGSRGRRIVLHFGGCEGALFVYVTLGSRRTRWSGFTRYSQRSGQQDIEGFSGQAWYSGEDLRPILPALWLGQWLHVGKSYVVSSGRCELALLGGSRGG